MNLKKIAAGAVVLALTADVAFILVEATRELIDSKRTVSPRDIRWKEFEHVKQKTGQKTQTA